jgi:hypothetical protein
MRFYKHTYHSIIYKNMKVFSSGSCRLLTSIHNGHRKITPIHSMFHNFVGINFLGKLHNVKQHIQFIKWIHDKIEIPDHILSSFLTSYGSYQKSRNGIEPLELNPIKKQNIKDAFTHCDVYIVEICSLKLYEKEGYQVQFELTDDYSCLIQSESELYNDLTLLQSLIPQGKKLIIQIHFRPNIIFNEVSKAIEKREVIYNVVNTFCRANKNVYLYDPSLLLRTDPSLFDGDTHFNERGSEMSFHYLYENFITQV